MNEKSNNLAVQKYAELMIQKIESLSVNEWKKPWIDLRCTGDAKNIDGRKYSHFNKLFLMFMSEKMEYRTPVFLTFRQAEKQKIQILKGSKAFPITYYEFIIKNILYGDKITLEEYNSLKPEIQKEYSVSTFLKYYNVFNLDQTNYSDKYPEKWESLCKEFQPKTINTDNYSCELLDKMIANQSWICPIILEKQNKAFYAPSKDFITLPTKQQFPQGKNFYDTALHEMAHSTGAKDRLNRKFGTIYGDPAYAREELVAELSSALSGRSIGLNVEPQQSSAQYLNCWLKKLKEDPHYIMAILQDVTKATAIIEESVGIENLIDTESSSTTEKENCTIATTPTKRFSADIVRDQDKNILEINNPVIQNKLTGEVLPLDTNGIELKDYKPSQLNDLLSGKKIDHFDSAGNFLGKLGLSKTPAGWGLSIGKQVVSLADSEAGI